MVDMPVTLRTYANGAKPYSYKSRFIKDLVFGLTAVALIGAGLLAPVLFSGIALATTAQPFLFGAAAVVALIDVIDNVHFYGVRNAAKKAAASAYQEALDSKARAQEPSIAAPAKQEEKGKSSWVGRLLNADPTESLGRG